MEERNYMLEVFIAGVSGLAEFLEKRPPGEDFGESLDFFEKHLMEEGRLSDEKRKIIRQCHQRYLSRLNESGLPIKRVVQPNADEDEIILSFCEDMDFMPNADLSEDHIRAFALAYRSVDSPYVNYNMAKILLRYNLPDVAWEYYDKALKTALFSIDKFWNNGESVYACSELLFDILSSEHFNRNSCSEDLMRNAVVYAYLLFSRVVLWPDENDKRIAGHDIPITYRHKIAVLNKRAELLLKFKDCFEDITPSYSTPEILAVSDYSLSHELAFIGKQIGLRSLFKIDAEKLYDSLADGNVRPYSTAINDAKDDSLELANRIYVKFKDNRYQLSSQDFSFMFQLLEEIVTERCAPMNKIDERQIRQYLSDNGIKYLYHFTEKENIPTIKKNGGICSLKHCLLNAVEVKTKGDMRVLRDADAKELLEDYARLSFCERHPLIKKRQAAGADLVLLKIKLDLAWRYDTLFSDRDAALPHHQHGGTFDDLKKVRMSAVRKCDLEEWDPDYDFNQAEVMVKGMIPIEYIVNIDDPIEIPPSASTQEMVTVTKEGLTKAINTLTYLGKLFKASPLLLSANDGRNLRKESTMYSYVGIFVYLYESVYRYGDFPPFEDMTLKQQCDKIKAMMSDVDNRSKAIADLANNWSGILQTILEIRNSRSREGEVFESLKAEISHVTDMIESTSGSKCRNPNMGYAKIADPQRSQFNRDAFSDMVENASVNPFGITNDPALQNFPPLPSDLYDTFKSGLVRHFQTYGKNRTDAESIFVDYVFSLVVSYYKEDGFVPKNTVDAMIEQCHKAIRETSYGWHIPSLDEMKHSVYSVLLS